MTNRNMTSTNSNSPNNFLNSYLNNETKINNKKFSMFNHNSFINFDHDKKNEQEKNNQNEYLKRFKFFKHSIMPANEFFI